MIKESLIVTLLSLLASIVTFINQLVLARYFGAGKLMDIYLTASSLPILISGLITAALSYSLTPHLIKIKVEKGEKEYNSYARQMIIKLSVYTGTVCLTGILLLSIFLNKIFPTIDNGNFVMAIQINILSWMAAFFFTLCAFNASYFNAARNFKLPLLFNFLPYAGCIAVSILFYQRLSIIAIPLGLFTGSLVAFLISFYIIQKNFNAGSIQPTSKISIRSYFSKLPLICVAMLCFTVYQSIDAFWAPRLGSAALSYLGYCQRILVAVGTLVILGPSTVLIPRLTLAIAENRNADFLKDTTTVIKIILALGSLFAVIGALLSEHIVRILFERGAFTSSDTKGIASLLPYMLTGMVFMLAVVMLFRVFFVKDMVPLVVSMGLISVLVYFAFSGVAIIVGSLNAIGGAYIITWFTLFAISMFWLYKNDVSVFICRKTLIFFLKQIIILMLVGLFTYFIQKISSSFFVDRFYNSLTVLFISGTGAILFYLLLTLKVFKQEEVLLLMRPILIKARLQKNA